MVHSFSRGLVSLGLLSLALAIIVGCAAGTPSTAPSDERTQDVKPQQATKEAVKGGKFVMTPRNQLGSAGHEDPHRVVTAIGKTLCSPVGDSLVTRNLFSGNYELLPDLAESWKMSPDGLEYTFNLRKGVKFHNVPPVNGREMTSEDVKYMFLRLKGDPSVIEEKLRPRFQRKAEFAAVKEVQTPDKNTVVLKLDKPYAPLMASIAFVGTWVLPKELIAQQKGEITDFCAGTGPFILAKYEKGIRAEYRRNPDYWEKDSKGTQLPYLDEFVQQSFQDVQAQFAAFMANQIERTGENSLQPAMLKEIKQKKSDAQIILTTKGSVYVYRFNTARKPFDDPRVRRAISLAFNRQEIIDGVLEGYAEMAGPITPHFTDYALPKGKLAELPGYKADKKADMDEAKRLLKEAGFENGIKIQTLISGTAGSSNVSADMTMVFQEQLKPLKITLDVETQEYATWLEKSVQNQFDMNLMTHALGTDPDSVYSVHYKTGGDRNYGKYSNPEIDKLIEQQATAVNLEQRKTMVNDIELKLINEAYMMWLGAVRTNIVLQPWIHGVGDGPGLLDNLNDFEWIWSEKK